MINRLLVYMRKNIEYDVFHSLNYKSLKENLINEGRNDFPNFGNKVWYQGILSEIYREDMSIDYYDYSGNTDYINNNYDAVLMPCANIFSEEFVQKLRINTEFCKKIKIPVYVISCGLQVGLDGNIDYLVSKIGEDSKRFIDSVYATGGDICLRGYITKEFFDKLGFDKAFVGGCPSIYQNGRDLIIRKAENIQQLKVAVNGHNSELKMPFYYKICKEKQNEFFDQDQYGDYLYTPRFLKDISFKKLVRMDRSSGYTGCVLLSENRINMFINVPDWMGYIVREGFDMSFGSRIHGNIVPLLCKVPSVVHVCDSRTKEIAEFYNIPTVTTNEIKRYKNIREIYEKADFSIFNNSFKLKYDQFEKFLVKSGFVNNINKNNLFGINKNIKKEIVNSSDIDGFRKRFNKNRIVYKALDSALYSYHILRKSE